jgi:hypothetical protein
MEHRTHETNSSSSGGGSSGNGSGNNTNTTNNNKRRASRDLTARRATKSPAFRAKLAAMALPLAPLVQLTTGEVHPAFPPTLLNFWLLTEAELEGLAHFYHQRTPSPWSRHYPCPIAWPPGLPLEEKRRRIGKFIGLRGCDTPVLPCHGGVGVDDVRSEDEILDDARRARIAEDDEEALWRGKMGFYY